MGPVLVLWVMPWFPAIRSLTTTSHNDPESTLGANRRAEVVAISQFDVQNDEVTVDHSTMQTMRRADRQFRYSGLRPVLGTRAPHQGTAEGGASDSG